ncbi:myb-like protein Z isoform X2 [Sitophilus oryzae]|uniref:Myb-like protein Z isoform X2 n=1 Tax=Sitophilus oryzae TaxID=7048 RepID=A0A6J2YML2_SITOR|nr:myb-like protein Z isoform X2 [Sitophilus oryzae]
MASKVIVKLPVAPFGQVNKPSSGSVNNDLILPKPQEVQKIEEPASRASQDQGRISQLEQNIRFLQEQHQLMLAGLHGEIEKLKQRNKELQFQLVFGKGPIPSSSPSPSSPEEDSKHKLYTSPKVITNTTPLQVELLEKELGELKIQMQELDTRNVYLSAIVDEQKKKLERFDRRREKEREQRANGKGDEVELLRKLEDAEALIRRLRRENSDLRREAQGGSGSAAQQNQGHYQEQQQQQAQHHGRENNGYSSPRGQNHRNGSGRGHRSNNGHYSRGGWFPPLHSQSFWQGGRQHNDRSHNGSQDANLPNISMNDGMPSSPPNQQQPYHGGQGRKGSNNNHYHNGDNGRKYRGGHSKNHKPS